MLQYSTFCVTSASYLLLLILVTSTTVQEMYSECYCIFYVIEFSKDTRCTCKITLWLFCVNIVAAEMQQYRLCVLFSCVCQQ